jgi:sulfur relay protein TusB/DsrH
MIHQLFDSPNHSTTLACCLDVAIAGDCLIFLQDSVLIAESLEWQSRLASFHVYFLQDDVIARAIQPCFGQMIDHDDWVELIATHQSPVSWI